MILKLLWTLLTRMQLMDLAVSETSSVFGIEEGLESPPIPSKPALSCIIDFQDSTWRRG